MVKKGSNFQLNQLQGKKSCHTGLGWSTGWNIPMRMLLPSDWSQEGKLARVGCPLAGFLLLGPTRIVLGPYNHCQVYGFHEVQDGVRTTCFKHVLAGLATPVTLVTGSWDFPSFSQRDPVSELLAAPHPWYPSSGV